jgi:hypothetical protein
MFNLADYETVEERLVKFWKDNPDGRIATELVEWAAGRFIVKALIYRTEADPQAWATGLAFEQVTDRGVNQTSALENCETSAIGRALANAGYASKGKRASREEMVKVAAAENDSRLVQVTAKIDAGSTNNGWGETYAASEPIPLGKGVEIVSQQINSQPNENAPTCNHMNGKATRTLKTGVSKAGKPYYGWVCAYQSHDKSGQCDPIWYRQDPVSGEWVKP